MAISGKRPSSLAQRYLTSYQPGQASVTRCKSCPHVLGPGLLPSRSAATRSSRAHARCIGPATRVLRDAPRESSTRVCPPCPWPGCRAPSLDGGRVCLQLPAGGRFHRPHFRPRGRGKTLRVEAVRGEPATRLWEISAMREASCLLTQECKLLFMPD